MDKAFNTGMRFDFNIVHNFEKIKQKIKEKELKNAKKEALNLPKIGQNYMNGTINKNFNSIESIGEIKNELSSANLKDNVSVFNDNNNNFKRTIYSQDFHKELSTDQNINNYNESKNASIICDNEESMNFATRKDFKKQMLVKNVKDPEELKALLDKELLGSKSNQSYQRMKTEIMFKSISNQKSSNMLLNQNTLGAEVEESNKFQYDRFLKSKTKLETHEENYDEENKIPEIENKEEEAAFNLFDSGLKKPKRKIQIAIFTQKNINVEEKQDLQTLMEKLELNDENNGNKKEDVKIDEKNAKGNDKNKKLTHLPLKHPLLFPEFNKYGMYSGFKKQELKVNYGMTVLKKNSNFYKNRSLNLNNSDGSQQDNKNNSTSNSPKKQNNKDKSSKKEILPKIKGKLLIFQDDPEIIKTIRALKHMNNLTLEEYQLKLIECGKKILDDDNLKNLVNRFKDITETTQTKNKIKYHKSINRWEIMVKVISRYIPEFLVEKLKSQK